MRRIAVILAFGLFIAGCTHAQPQPFAIVQPRPARGELRPIEAMAVFRQAAMSADWQTVRSTLAEDDESAQQSIQVQKGWNRGGWLLVPVAETVRGDVTIVIVSQRMVTHNGPSWPSPVPIAMAKVADHWMIVDSERIHWQLPPDQADRLLALSRTDGTRLASFYEAGARAGSYTVRN